MKSEVLLNASARKMVQKAESSSDSLERNMTVTQNGESRPVIQDYKFDVGHQSAVGQGGSNSNVNDVNRLTVGSDGSQLNSVNDNVMVTMSFNPLPSQQLYPSNKSLITASNNNEDAMPVMSFGFPQTLPSDNNIATSFSNITHSNENSPVTASLVQPFPSIRMKFPLIGCTYPSPNGLHQEGEFLRPSNMVSAVGSSPGLNLTTTNLFDNPLTPVITATNVLHNPSIEINEEGSLQDPHLQSPVMPSYLKLYTSPEKDGINNAMVDFYECRWVQCDKKFLNMDDLVNHVNDQHVKVERPDVDYQCKWNGCPRKGKGFNARYKMLIHIRTHTNEKPHKCNICGKCFSRLENLKIHNRSHTGEKPYICPFEGCSKAYSNSSDRFKHVRTHQEEKPYICKMPGCNKRYTDPSSLRKHVRTHGHYYRSGESDNLSSKSKNHLTQMLPNIPSSVPSHHGLLPLTTVTPPVNRLLPLSPNGLLPSTVSPQLLSVHSAMNVSNFTSNPLLSSAILTNPVPTQTISTQTDSVSASLPPGSPIKMDLNGAEKIAVDSEGKCQDGPLDLTTSPTTDSDIDVGERENVNFTPSKWELINS